MTLKYGSKEYKIGLTHLGLRVYSRNDPDTLKWGLHNKYLVAPLILCSLPCKHGESKEYHGVGWQVYYYNSEFNNTRKTMKSYKTKKEAVEAVREHVTHEPWYAGLPGYGTARGVYLSDGVYVGGNPRFDR